MESCYYAIKNNHSKIVELFCEKKVLTTEEIVTLLQRGITNNYTEYKSFQVLLDYAANMKCKNDTDTSCNYLLDENYEL